MRRIGYKWVALGLLWVMYFLLQGSRQMYGAMLPMIRADLQVDDVRMGVVASAFFCAYAVAVPFGGFLADFMRRKWVIVAGALMLSIGIFSSAFVAGIGVLALTYGIINGIGQSFVPTPSTSIIQQLHADSRATALSIYQLALFLGVILCSVSAGWIGSLGQGSWRSAFVIFGALSFVWVVVLMVFLRNTPAEVSPDGHDRRASLKEGFFALWSKPSAVLLMLAFGFCNFGDTGYAVWAPAYLLDAFEHMTPARAAFNAVFWLNVGCVLGIVVASRVSDLLRRRGVIRARLICNIAGLLLCAPIMFLATRPFVGLSSFVVIMTIYGFVHGFYDANFVAAFYEVITPRYRTAAYGLYAGGAFAIVAFAPFTLGLIAKATSLRSSISTLSGFYLIAGLLTLVACVRFLKNDYEG